MSSIILLLVFFLSEILCKSPSKTAVVSNILPKRDQSGAIMDIHDGNTIRVGDTFFWYGAGYGPCTEMSTGCASLAVGSCGFNTNHTVNLATSVDLEHWEFHGTVLPERPYGILFSPWVARSKSTGKYVLWFNLLPVIDGRGDFLHSYYVVAASETPYGPFEIVNKNVTGIAYHQLPDAPSIFVDDDMSGYVAFTHESSHINHVQQLTPDLYGPLPGGKVSEQIGEGNNEGILMFKREGMYYVMFGPCCCFCKEGSDVDVFVSTSPIGPYRSVGRVVDASTWHAQTGSVWFTGEDWVLYGDRWQSAPDNIKAHDFSYWATLTFNNGSSIETLRWQDSVMIRY